MQPGPYLHNLWHSYQLWLPSCREAFEFEHITNWVERIRRSAGESVVAIRGEVASVSLQAPWDGKDAKVEVEDEFSLDDIMNDEE